MIFIIITNINKMNNHLSSQTTEHRFILLTIYGVGNPGPDLGQT